MKAASVFLVLVCLATTLSGREDKNPTAAPKEKVLVLDPIRVSEAPIISFAIDIAIYADPQTDKVTKIFITRVLEDTDAARAGLRKGDEIVKLDGVPVKGLDPRVRADTPLGRLLLGRDPGDALKLDVIFHHAEELTLRAQRGFPGPKLR